LKKGTLERRSYGKLKKVLDLPDLLAVQRESYNDFLQADVPPEKRKKQGLQAVFENIFPISDVHGLCSLEFVEYSLGKPEYSEEECKERDMTYAAPLRAKLRLNIREEKGGDFKESIEQTVFLGELPLMTERGTFIINGAERVVVSQLHRSPGVFFDETVHPNGKRLYSARIIPYHHGSWIEFSMDVNDAMYVHIDRKRKIPVTTLLRALGFSSDEEIISLFHTIEAAKVDDSLVGKVLLDGIEDESSGKAVEKYKMLSEEDVAALKEMGVKEVRVIHHDGAEEAFVIENTLKKDSCTTEEEALYRIYSLMRPGDPPNMETARALIKRLFFDPKRYDLGDVGRYRINQRLNIDVPMEKRVLDERDFIAIIRYLIGLRNGEGYVDDIDHLGNRRCRTVGELITHQFSAGLSRMARTIKERMSLRDSEGITPHELVNARTISTVIASFFGSSQLSQFMQQTNPLDELTHKRRLSALGPGGLTRGRAGFEVRDVHHTHYGRMCPIETPEGPNIGLITSLSTYARVNKFGFLETPYRVVENGRVTDRIEYLTADQEDRHTIAQANAPLNPDGTFKSGFVRARRRGEFLTVPIEQVDYMDVSPMQLVSVSAALIPFLEHDDANRALMGSNMQRQAVPLLRPEPPLVGTGIEHKVAVDSGAVVVAKEPGVVTKVSADEIVVKVDEDSEGNELGLFSERVYKLAKFKRSNQDTCINQRPLVSVGDRVEKGDVLADGQATCQGDLSLGTNLLVAFLPWHGYNFEDAIVVSERLVFEDLMTSIHIKEFELQVRDTKRGPEELTREIPNVSEDAVKNLDERGIIRIGAEVKSGDILVGKVTPKGETELSPEERLLRAIFGEKAGDVREACLKVPPGMEGVVIDTKLFSRKEKDEKTKQKDREQIALLRRKAEGEVNRIRSERDRKIRKILKERKVNALIDAESGGTIFEGGKALAEELADALDFDKVRPAVEGKWTEDDEINSRVENLLRLSRELIDSVYEEMEREIEKVRRGDELPPGVLQLVKVYIAQKRRLQVGDKLAGRHGNKGVVAKIVPAEDMPYLPDGTPVDIVLNPLGVPNRMNLGQVLETHLGWAAHKLGIYVNSPVFDGASIEEIKGTLREAGLPETGKTILYDGQTGEPFDKEVTVGYIYMMKLSHLVADKIHARSIGPYSLVTQQPLGGKAQFGGQRFGEMEVWALEAYGAAHLLQEMLTVKSDDVVGRSKIYEAIVKGENPPEPGIPESFNVLVKELQGLCLDVTLFEDEETS